MPGQLGPWRGARRKRIWPYVAEAFLTAMLIGAGGAGILLLILAVLSSTGSAR